MGHQTFKMSLRAHENILTETVWNEFIRVKILSEFLQGIESCLPPNGRKHTALHKALDLDPNSQWKLKQLGSILILLNCIQNLILGSESTGIVLPWIYKGVLLINLSWLLWANTLLSLAYLKASMQFKLETDHLRVCCYFQQILMNRNGIFNLSQDF